jgi:hypothetical protein
MMLTRGRAPCHSSDSLRCGADTWHHVSAHPGMVQLQEAFMYQGCAFFVTDYHPRAETLAQRSAQHFHRDC